MKTRKKLRVVFVAPLPPPVHGSAMMSSYIRDSRLINEELDCRYVNMSTSRRMDEIGRCNPIKIFRFAASYCRLLWLLLTFHPDCCHLAITCHGIGFLKDAPFVLLCKLFRRKILIHQHNKGMSKCADRGIYRHLLPMCYRNTTVVLLSWRLYPDIAKVVDRNQVVICPNGIPETASKEYAKSENGIPNLLFLSNLLIDKGVLVLLDALKVLKDRGCSFCCNFVGGETAEIDAKRFGTEVTKRRLDGQVRYKGKRYDKEKEEELRNADIFVLPTNNDCFPLVLLEAMQYSLPIVATNVGGICDIVEDGKTGLIAEKQNSTDLANKIESLLANPERYRQMGNEGRLRYEQNFRKEIFEKNLADILKQTSQ